MVAGTPSSPGMFSDSDAGSGMSWAALWIDDNDGWEDVFIASDFGVSQCIEIMVMEHFQLAQTT